MPPRNRSTSPAAAAPGAAGRAAPELSSIDRHTVSQASSTNSSRRSISFTIAEASRVARAKRSPTIERLESTTITCRRSRASCQRGSFGRTAMATYGDASRTTACAASIAAFSSAVFAFFAASTRVASSCTGASMRYAHAVASRSRSGSAYSTVRSPAGVKPCAVRVRRSAAPSEPDGESS